MTNKELNGNQIHLIQYPSFPQWLGPPALFEATFSLCEDSHAGKALAGEPQGEPVRLAGVRYSKRSMILPFALWDRLSGKEKI